MLGDSSLFIFTITKNDISFQQQRLDDSLFKHINGLRQNLFRHRSGIKTQDELISEFNDFTDNAFGLYQQLLKPVLSKYDTKDLIIIPDGILGYIPFQVLLQEKTENISLNYRTLPYLFLDHTIRYEYSATLSFHEYPIRKTKNQYAGFGPEYEGDELLASRSSSDSLLVANLYEETARDGLVRLKYNQPEVIEASEAMGGKAFNGSEALESNFKREAPNSNIIHLAMHTLTNDKAPLYSQLIFSKEPDSLEDGLLHAYELYNMKFNSNLAVLSACNTGGGKLQKGEGIMSLSRAFKYAGCPNIVMSLWKVDDLSTKEIMSSFFKNLKSGKKKNVALQQARKDYLEYADEQFLHPYYWGTFVLIGDDQPVGLGKRNWLWWIIGSMFAIFIGVGWRIKHLNQF